jgi:hypothetical protein
MRPVLDAYVSVTGASYTAKGGNRLIGVNRAGVVTITLPSTQLRFGRSYTIKDESGAAATNNITLATEGSETIDGSATNTISENYGAKTSYSDGSNWFTVPVLGAPSHTLASHSAKAHSDLSDAPAGAHHAQARQADHASAGALKLDDLAAPDDNTDLNYSTTKHGLVPKGANAGNFLKYDGTWAAGAGGLSYIVEDLTPQLGGDLDANLKDITGVGHIGFLATPDPSAGANDLDDYEEGTFTPTLQDDSRSDAESQTYTRQIGHYTKIGRIVHYWIRIEVSGLGSLTTSQGAVIAGLPFTSVTVTGGRQASNVSFGGSLALPNASENLSAEIGTNATIVDLHLWDATTGTTNALISEISVGADLAMAGSYEV